VTARGVALDLDRKEPRADTSETGALGANQIPFLELPGSAINGAFLDNNAQTGLIHNSVGNPEPGRYIFSIRGGAPLAHATAVFLQANLDGTTTVEPASVLVGQEPSVTEELDRIVQFRVQAGLTNSATQLTTQLVDGLVEDGQVPPQNASQLIATVVQQAPSVAPQITDVRVDFGTQSASVLDPSRTLPWVNIMGLDIVFSTNVNVTQSDLVVTGTNIANYAISGFSYDATTHTAHWSLSRPLALDQVSLALDGHTAAGVHDANGHFLLGGNFLEGLSVLPGDIDGNGVVDSADVVDVYNAIHQPYNVFDDINGDGAITLADVILARALIGHKLP
jgi:hypothetical protein